MCFLVVFGGDMEARLKCGVQGMSNNTQCTSYINARRNKQKPNNRAF